jgi:hypothetical protein
MVTIAVCCGVFPMAETALAASRTKPTRTQVSIEAWPKGFFGYVSSPQAARCAAGRWVAVFAQRGRRPNRAKDRRVATVRSARKPGSYQWSTKTRKRGRFYARALSKQGCRVANSNTFSAPVSGVPGGGADAGYPPCSAYVSEGTTTICRFPEIHLELDQQAAFTPCRFGRGEGDCDGASNSGPFPWGNTPFGFGVRKVKFFWDWGTKRVTFVAYEGDGNTGIAHLGGTVPNSSSGDFTITDGFAADDRGYPNGDHFYTPNIPGQGAGEVGGPLFLNFVNGSGTDFGADVYIRGYLYLKR